MSDQHFETVRTRPSRSTSAVATPPSSSPSSLAQAGHSDLRTNYKQFGLKAITSQIENQPANHPRSTNVHRATHAESYALCVNYDTNCVETSNANLLRDSFNLLAQQRIRSSGLHRTIAGIQLAASRRHDPRRFQISAAFCSTMKYQVCIRPIVDSIADFSNSFSNSFASFSKLVRIASKLSVTLFHLNT